MPQLAPTINGIMTLTSTDSTTIKTKLLAIQNAFVATDNVPVCDTFYLTSTYNKANPTALINGDTCQAVLAPPVTGV